jgi:hypothetical protein
MLQLSTDKKKENYSFGKKDHFVSTVGSILAV